ncbi:MAG TPA: hypothetical protein VG265_12635 [Gaiellaceae bacterium]|nr:hypothetical protein [Gaiellaceae bacterium]
MDDDFRFCPGCGVPLRSKLVEYFGGNPELGDGALRVSVYFRVPQHVRLSIWRGDAAQAALSLDPPEADRLVAFLQSVCLTRSRRLEFTLRQSARAVAATVVSCVKGRA